MPRGGSRPGAGAPKGNLNALKHGWRSPGLRAIARALISVASVRSILLEYARFQRRQQRRALHTARYALTRIELPNNQTAPLSEHPSHVPGPQK